MDHNAGEIAKLVQDVPIMCVGTVCGSSIAKTSLVPDWPTGGWMASQGLKNDGLVPVASTILPGARFVTLDGFGHGQVARHHIFSGRKLENVDLLKALFALMLNERDLSETEAA